MGILIGILTAVHVVVALVIIMLVLMQKSSEQGVGAAFGAGMTDTVFGAGTSSALQRMTIWCACALLATTLILAVLHSHRTASSGSSLMQKAIQSAPAPAPAMPVLPGAEPKPMTPAPTTPAAPATPGVQAVPSATPTPAPAAEKK